MRRRADRLGPLVLLALLAAAALYRATDTGSAAPSLAPQQTPPERPAPETPKPPEEAVALLKVQLPPPPAAAPRQPAPAPAVRRALQPTPPPTPEPAAAARPALRPAPEAAPPVPAPRAALKPAERPPRPLAERAALAPEKPAPASTPQPRKALKPMPPAPPPPRPTPSPQRAPAPKAVAARTPDPAPPAPVPDQGAVERAGRSLLRVLEHGQGPAIEIAWPDGASARAALYRRLVDCHGMQVALMDPGGRLFAATGTPGTPWAINMDRYSGFVRQAEGRITAAERGTADRIAARHRLGRAATIVRVFPRGVDASLLGGLHGLLGEAYAGSAAIRGRYSLAGGRLTVTDITADGRPAVRAVLLSPARGGRCR